MKKRGRKNVDDYSDFYSEHVGTMSKKGKAKIRKAKRLRNKKTDRKVSLDQTGWVARGEEREVEIICLMYVCSILALSTI